MPRASILRGARKKKQRHPGRPQRSPKTLPRVKPVYTNELGKVW